MYPYIQIILPSYTVMALVGGGLTLYFLYFNMEKYQIQFTQFLQIFFFCVLGGIVGSKILFAITQIPWLIENFSVTNLLLLIPQSGLVFYGGLFGVIVTLLLMTRKDEDFRKRIFRLAVPAMPLFHGFGRIGCFLTGCCYGKELISPISVGPLEITQVPVQLIEAFTEFIVFIVLVIINKKKEEVDLLRIYLIIYAFVRFADEFLRGDKVRGIYFGISTAQWISIIIVMVYVLRFVKSRRCEKE